MKRIHRDIKPTLHLATSEALIVCEPLMIMAFSFAIYLFSIMVMAQWECWDVDVVSRCAVRSFLTIGMSQNECSSKGELKLCLEGILCIIFRWNVAIIHVPWFGVRWILWDFYLFFCYFIAQIFGSFLLCAFGLFCLQWQKFCAGRMHKRSSTQKRSILPLINCLWCDSMDNT